MTFQNGKNIKTSALLYSICAFVCIVRKFGVIKYVNVWSLYLIIKKRFLFVVKAHAALLHSPFHEETHNKEEEKLHGGFKTKKGSSQTYNFSLQYVGQFCVP